MAERTPITIDPIVFQELPSSLMGVHWIDMRHWKSAWLPIIFAESDRVKKAAGWNPKVIRLEGTLHMLDLAVVGGSMISIPTSIKVVDLVDHPFLEKLPKNAPRAVKAIYTKGVRLTHVRSHEAWPYLNDHAKAEEAWLEYRNTMTSRPYPAT